MITQGLVLSLSIHPLPVSPSAWFPVVYVLLAGAGALPVRVRPYSRDGASPECVKTQTQAKHSYVYIQVFVRLSFLEIWLKLDFNPG